MERQLNATPYPAWTVWSGMVALIIFSAQSVMIAWLGIRAMFSPKGNVGDGLLIALIGVALWALLLVANRFLLGMRYAVPTSWKLAWLGSLAAVAAATAWLGITFLAEGASTGVVTSVLSALIYWAPIIGVAGWVIGVITERSRRQNRFD